VAKESRDIAASVRARLLSYAKAHDEDFNLTLVRFAIERLLYRLTNSPYSDQFVLKGAMLYVVWGIQPYRPTRDVDLLGLNTGDPDSLQTMFQELCDQETEPDGITFDSSKVAAAYIREQNEYGGIRIGLTGYLARARIQVQVDVGIGDAITPGPEQVDYPTLLDDLPGPVLRAYPVYTVLAEKFEAIVRLDLDNTRMKDFFDIWTLSDEFELDGDILGRAIQATFQRRKTPIPSERPIALTDRFYADNLKGQQWRAFLKKTELEAVQELSLESVANRIWLLCGQASSSENRGKTWSPMAGWCACTS
jgi:hypothetical protein